MDENDDQDTAGGTPAVVELQESLGQELASIVKRIFLAHRGIDTPAENVPAEGEP